MTIKFINPCLHTGTDSTCDNYLKCFNRIMKRNVRSAALEGTEKTGIYFE